MYLYIDVYIYVYILNFTIATLSFTSVQDDLQAIVLQNYNDLMFRLLV